MADKTLFDFDYTWNGKEADEIFAKPIFTDPMVTDIFRVVPNIKGKQKLAVDTALAKVLKKVTTCARNPSGNLITISERFIETELVGVDLEQCVLPLRQQITEQFLNSGNDIFSLEGTYLQTYLEGKVVDALKSDIPRVAFFGDKASVDENYNQLDGIWKHIFALSATNPTMRAADIPATLPDPTDAAGAKAVIAIFRNLYKKQAPVMKALPKARKRYIVNSELAEALSEAYDTIGGGTNGELYIRRVQGAEGEDQIFYKGIPVIGMSAWTEIIDNDLAGAMTFRAILTDTQNLIIGTDRVSDMMEVNLEYHKYQRVNTLDANFQLGTQILWPELTVFSTQAA